MVVPRGRGLISKSVSWPFLFFMSSDYFSTGVYNNTDERSGPRAMHTAMHVNTVPSVIPFSA